MTGEDVARASAPTSSFAASHREQVNLIKYRPGSLLLFSLMMCAAKMDQVKRKPLWSSISYTEMPG